MKTIIIITFLLTVLFIVGMCTLGSYFICSIFQYSIWFFNWHIVTQISFILISITSSCLAIKYYFQHLNKENGNNKKQSTGLRRTF
jgi:hypothetical protein